MTEQIEAAFPLSKQKTIKGSRRLAREKAVQVLYAYELSGEAWTKTFEYLFGRRFNFGDDKPGTGNSPEEPVESGKLMSMTQVYESDADIPIDWDEGNLRYAKTIIEKTLENKAMYDEIVREKVKNWDIDRINIIDKIAVYIAATEMICVEGTPIRVSINEAVEIGRKYSTDNSGVFINGVIEPFMNILLERGLIPQIKVDEFKNGFPRFEKKKKKAVNNSEKISEETEEKIEKSE